MWTSTIDLAAANSGQPSAGPSALVLVVLLGVAIALLVRNMDRRLRRMPRTFDPDAKVEPTVASAATPRQPGQAALSDVPFDDARDSRRHKRDAEKEL